MNIELKTNHPLCQSLVVKMGEELKATINELQQKAIQNNLTLVGKDVELNAVQYSISCHDTTEPAITYLGEGDIANADTLESLFGKVVVSHRKHTVPAYSGWVVHFIAEVETFDEGDNSVILDVITEAVPIGDFIGE